MIKIYLYAANKSGMEPDDCDKKLIASLGDENQLYFFKHYIKETYGKSNNMKITYKLPYQQENTILNTFNKL